MFLNFHTLPRDLDTQVLKAVADAERPARRVASTSPAPHTSAGTRVVDLCSLSPPRMRSLSPPQHMSSLSPPRTRSGRSVDASGRDVTNERPRSANRFKSVAVAAAEVAKASLATERPAHDVKSSARVNLPPPLTFHNETDPPVIRELRIVFFWWVTSPSS